MTVGEFKQWLIDNDVDDDAPLWKLDTVTEGGCEYPSDYAADLQGVALHTNTYGIALPISQWKTETGVALW
jgi:hypothetical protein